MQTKKLSLVYSGLALAVIVLCSALSIYVLLSKETRYAVPETGKLDYQLVPLGPLGGSSGPSNQVAGVEDLAKKNLNWLVASNQEWFLGLPLSYDISWRQPDLYLRNLKISNVEYDDLEVINVKDYKFKLKNPDILSPSRNVSFKLLSNINERGESLMANVSIFATPRHGQPVDWFSTSDGLRNLSVTSTRRFDQDYYEVSFPDTEKKAYLIVDKCFSILVEFHQDDEYIQELIFGLIKSSFVGNHVCFEQRADIEYVYKDGENGLSVNYQSIYPPDILKDYEKLGLETLYAERRFVIKVTSDTAEVEGLINYLKNKNSIIDKKISFNGNEFRELSAGEGAAGSTYVETYFVTNKNNQYYVFGFLDVYCNACEYASDSEREAVNKKIDDYKYTIMQNVFID